MKKLSVKFKLFLSIVLGVVLLISSAFVFNVVKDSKQPIYSQSSVADGSGTEMVSGKVYSMPKSMTFSNTSSYSVNAQGGITVKATVKPDSLTDKSVSWSLAWVNAESGFAKGKDVLDYVELTSNSFDNTATIKCLKPFSEKINLTATSVFDTYKSATCVIDYAKRLSCININLSNTSLFKDFVNGTSSGGEFFWEYPLLSDDVIFEGLSFEYGDEGTVMPTDFTLSLGRYFSITEYYDVISDYLFSVTTINGIEIVPGSATFQFAEDNIGSSYYLFGDEWTGGLFDKCYIAGYHSVTGEDIWEPVTKHVELLDLLVDKYASLNEYLSSPLYPFMTVSSSVNDGYNFYTYAVNIYLEGEALNSTCSVEVSLDSEGVVL